MALLLGSGSTPAANSTSPAASTTAGGESGTASTTASTGQYLKSDKNPKKLSHW